MLTPALSAEAGRWFLLFALPIAGWAMVSDLTKMRIPNGAVVALTAVYALVGPLVLPVADWAWGWAQLAVVLCAGLALYLSGGFGAGDAKFAAAMAPFVALPDVIGFLLLLSVMTLGSFALHRSLRALRSVRTITARWESSRRAEFPFALALAPALVTYLALAAAFGP